MIILALLTKNDTEQKFFCEHGQRSQKNFHQCQVYIQLPHRDRECSQIQLHKLMFHQMLEPRYFCTHDDLECRSQELRTRTCLTCEIIRVRSFKLYMGVVYDNPSIIS